MNLKEYCGKLGEKQLLNLAVKICEIALPIWENYSLSNSLEYTENIAGTNHKVRSNLLEEVLIFCRRQDIKTQSWEKDISLLLNEFVDPISAIQSFDWELPNNVVLVFHSFYNLIVGLKKPQTLFNEQCHYVAINQSLEAIETNGLMNLEQIKHLILVNT